MAGLGQIEPALADADLSVTGNDTTYTIEVASPSGATFSIARGADGAAERTCSPPGTGGCPASGDWR